MKKFCVDSAQTVPTILGVKLDGFNEDNETKGWSFRELVGSLIWLSTYTRPDIRMQFDQ